MPEDTHYHLPGACSRVAMTALEQCEVDYADHPVNLMQGEQHSPAFREVNPRGKFPRCWRTGKRWGRMRRSSGISTAAS